MNLEYRMRVMFVMVIATMTGLNACGEEQGTTTNLPMMAQGITQTGSQKNLAQPTPKKEQFNMWMTVNGHRFELILEDNAATHAFASQVPPTLQMKELNRNAKHGQLSGTLPADAQPLGIIHNGDLMLYGSKTLVVFDQTFASSYSYTRLAKVKHSEKLAEILGDGDVEIKFNQK